MKIIKTLMLSLCIIGFAFSTQAQLNQKSDDDKFANQDKLPDNDGKIDWDRFFVGGNVGNIGISNGAIFADVSPHIGYYVTDKFVVGAGPSFNFLKFDSNQQRYFGGNAFARYDIFRGLFLHSEFDYLNFKRKFDGIQIGESRNFPALLAGGGLNISAGGRSFFSAMILYNFLNNQVNDQFYPFVGVLGNSNPIIRIGGGFRL